jgi:hypothetical protein
MNRPDKIFQLDAICSRFDAAWTNSPQPPELDSFLAEVCDAQRDELFELLLPIDVEYRRNRSLDCDSATYINRFPQYSNVIDKVLSPSETVSLNQDSSVQEEADFSAEMAATIDHVTARPRSDDLQPGRRQIGRYTVLKELGGGGQADVYRAAHPTLPIEVVIKVGRQKLNDSARQ